MESLGQGDEHESRYSDAELRALLAHEATPEQHIEGLLAVGLTHDNLFEVLIVHEEDLDLVPDDVIEEHLEDVRTDPESARAALLEFSGVEEEDLYDVEAYEEAQIRKHNQRQRDNFADAAFLRRRGQRILKDLTQAASILMEDNAANRPLIAAWLLTPNLTCEGERPLDRLKHDPVQVLAMARGLIFDDSGEPGKIPDAYGQML